MKILAILFAALAAINLSAQTLDLPSTSAETQDPYSENDGSWIAIHGEVKSVGHEQFVLNYGDGSINVHLENPAVEGGDHKFIEGEKVRVYGIVDEGFLRGTAILARAVFVESMSTYVYATDGAQEFIRISTPGIASGTVVQGIVNSISGRNIMLDKGDRMLTVDTSTLTDDPTGAGSAHQIKVGDQVAIVGNMGRNFFAGRTVRATSILPLDGVDEPMHGSDREY